jgi:hypothetical protein
METQEEKLPVGHKVAESIAVVEVKQFVEFHLEKTIDIDKVIEDYPEIILAVQLGLMVFNDDQVPTYTLKTPIKTVTNEIAVQKVTFQTRIIASKQAELGKGIDMKKDMLTYINKMRAYYIGQPVAMLDKLGKFDFKVIDQTVSVF